MSNEKVLCIKKENLPNKWIEKYVSLNLNENEFEKKINSFEVIFESRKLAEKNFELKQIIPYILIQNSKKHLTGIYKRKGSEKRLEDLWSAGIGGHINNFDCKKTVYETIKNGMLRELSEEIINLPKNYSITFCGIINEEKTEVGNVHLGAVYKIISDDTNAFLPGEELDSFQFYNTSDLKNLNMEIWSGLALKL
ncbi:MAG: phosphoesterase [Desulforegulaceae bacterium]|nr:phosphoesterase [Desulforegulaceae bacterium]